MTTIQPRQGKYCPQCSTMTLPNALRCSHCGHHFSLGLVAETVESLSAPMTEENLNRTRMFTLPPFLVRPQTPAEDSSPTILSDGELAELENSLAATRGTQSKLLRVYGITTVVILLALTLLWWLVSHT